MKYKLVVHILLMLMMTIFMQQSFAKEGVVLHTNAKMFTHDMPIMVNGHLESGEQGRLVGMELKDSAGKTILVRTLQTDRSGDFRFQFKIPPTSRAGLYTIVASLNEGGVLLTNTKEIAYETTQTEATPITKKTEKVGLVQEENLTQDKQSYSVTESSKGGGCLIATAAYGTEMSSEVQMLRELRDNAVFGTSSGTAFMSAFNQFYYSFSPAIADGERQNPTFKETMKTIITPMIWSLSILRYANINSEQQMLGYGIGIIMLNVGMYFVGPAIAITMLARRLKDL